MKLISEEDARIGKRIRAARLARGFSQEKLAEPLNLTFQQVQKYENGINRVSGSRLVVIASMLGVSVGHLVGEDAHEPETNDVLSALSSPGGHELAVRFNRLSDARRKLLVEIAGAMA